MMDRRSGNFSGTVTSYLAIRNRTAYDIVSARLADGIQRRLIAGDDFNAAFGAIRQLTSKAENSTD